MTAKGTDKKFRQQVLLKSSYLGVLAGCTSLIFQHPFDTVKTCMQSSKSNNIILTAKQIRKNKGMSGFYSGFIVNCGRIALKQIYRWPMMIYFTNFYSKLLSVSQTTSSLFTGSSIAFIQVGIITPFERVKVWLMTSQQKLGIINFFKNESQTLFRGLYPVFLKQSVSWITFLASTSFFKDIFKKKYKTQKLNQYQIFMVSLPVSLINTVFVMPIDFIKTQYQKNQIYKLKKLSFMNIVKQNYAKIGVRGFYVGWEIKLIQYAINSLFTVGVIQSLMNQFKDANV